jgi:hypothetical protein
MSLDVIYRISRKTGEIVAVFPEVPTDISGKFCKCYSSLSRFGSVDYTDLSHKTKIAVSKDYNRVHDTLLGLGYCLNIVSKCTATHTKTRKERVKDELLGIE